jgi:hypothetical protein
MSVPPPSLGGTAVGGALVGSALAAAAGALVAAGAAGAAVSSSSEPHAMAVIANSPTSKLMTITAPNLFGTTIIDFNIENISKCTKITRDQQNAVVRTRSSANTAKPMSCQSDSVATLAYVYRINIVIIYIHDRRTGPLKSLPSLLCKLGRLFTIHTLNQFQQSQAEIRRKRRVRIM